MEKVMASNSNNEQFNLSRGGQLKPDEPNPFTFGAPQVRTKEKRKVHTTLKPHKSNATTSSIVAEVKKDNTAAGQQVDKIQVTGEQADLFTALDDTQLKNLRPDLRHSRASEAGAQRPKPHAIAAVQKLPSQQSFLETMQTLQGTKTGRHGNTSSRLESIRSTFHSPIRSVWWLKINLISAQSRRSVKKGVAKVERSDFFSSLWMKVYSSEFVCRMNIIFFLVDMKGTSCNRLTKSKLWFVKLYCVIPSNVGRYALCDTILLCIHKIRFRFSNQRARILFCSFKLVPLNFLTPRHF
jgi:hypothetical protein